MLNDLHFKAEMMLEEESYLEGLYLLQRMDQLVQTYQENGGKISEEISLCIYNNLAFCFQK